eukprot:TRINITY_DN4314_c0_g1_i1.p3 TRINITY_DN4314_c0_g1~~TRINITY_DN4314_c0_g1_i1.p3  ORF type:complete len:131 (-),score=35.50 TRINITY_DN4314_c0_g1_i1:15-407(-)
MSNEQIGHTTGDVRVRVQTRRHPRFVRRGEDLVANLSVSLKEALCGFSHTVRHLDNTDVVFASEPLRVVPHAAELVAPGKGLTSAGSMIVGINVEFPARLTAAQRQAVQRLLAPEQQQQQQQQDGARKGQ